MGRPKKEPWADLPDEWITMIQSATSEAIDEEIVRLTKYEEANRQTKEDDENLAEKKEEAKVAGEGYREATKGYKLRMRYIMETLQSRSRT